MKLSENLKENIESYKKEFLEDPDKSMEIIIKLAENNEKLDFLVDGWEKNYYKAENIIDNQKETIEYLKKIIKLDNKFLGRNEKTIDDLLNLLVKGMIIACMFGIIIGMIPSGSVHTFSFLLLFSFYYFILFKENKSWLKRKYSLLKRKFRRKK